MAVTPGSPPQGSELVDDRFVLFGQIASALTLESDNLGILLWTATAAGTIFDPVAKVFRFGWQELNTIFREFTGSPVFRTILQQWAEIITKPYSVHFEDSEIALRTFLGSVQWNVIMTEVGKGDGQLARELLTNAIATAETLVGYDGQFLLDDHPGLKLNAATKEYEPVTHTNWAPATAFDDVAVDQMVGRMTEFTNQVGINFGNKYSDHGPISTTNNRDTQVPVAPQFHVFAGSSAIVNVKKIHRMTGTDPSVHAGRYSYSKLSEIQPERWFVRWLNNANQAPVTRPFVQRNDGLSVFASGIGETLHSQRHRRREIHAHSDRGIGVSMWHGCYGGEEP